MFTASPQAAWRDHQAHLGRTLRSQAAWLQVLKSHLTTASRFACCNLTDPWDNTCGSCVQTAAHRENHASVSGNFFPRLGRAGVRWPLRAAAHSYSRRPQMSTARTWGLASQEVGGRIRQEETRLLEHRAPAVAKVGLSISSVRARLLADSGGADPESGRVRSVDFIILARPTLAPKVGVGVGQQANSVTASENDSFLPFPQQPLCFLFAVAQTTKEGNEGITCNSWHQVGGCHHTVLGWGRLGGVLGVLPALLSLCSFCRWTLASQSPLSPPGRWPQGSGRDLARTLEERF